MAAAGKPTQSTLAVALRSDHTLNPAPCLLHNLLPVLRTWRGGLRYPTRATAGMRHCSRCSLRVSCLPPIREYWAVCYSMFYNLASEQWSGF